MRYRDEKPKAKKGAQENVTGEMAEGVEGEQPEGEG